MEKIIGQSKIFTNGRVTVPKKVRDELGLKPGDQIRFRVVDGGVVLQRKVRRGKREVWSGRVEGASKPNN